MPGLRKARFRDKGKLLLLSSNSSTRLINLRNAEHISPRQRLTWEVRSATTVSNAPPKNLSYEEWTKKCAELASAASRKSD